jgi:hypothetical protein
MTMKQAQARCRALRRKGDRRSLMEADRIQAQFANHPNYESDAAWLLRMQSGEQGLYSPALAIPSK